MTYPVANRDNNDVIYIVDEFTEADSPDFNAEEFAELWVENLRTPFQEKELQQAIDAGIIKIMPMTIPSP